MGDVNEGVSSRALRLPAVCEEAGMDEAMSAITAEEEREVEAANASGRTPVAFVHGLWLLPSSWDRWAELFEHAGYAAMTPGWPDDPETVEEAREHPEVLAGKSIGEIADHFEAVIGKLGKKPSSSGTRPAPVDRDPGGPWIGGGFGRDQSSAGTRSPPASLLVASRRVSGTEEPGEQASRRAIDLRPVPIRIRQLR